MDQPAGEKEGEKRLAEVRDFLPSCWMDARMEQEGMSGEEGRTSSASLADVPYCKRRDICYNGGK